MKLHLKAISAIVGAFTLICLATSCTKDLEKIEDLCVYLSGDPCKLMKEISGRRINIETAVAINRKLKFADSWKGNFTYPTLWLKIKKLDRFVKFNEQVIFEKIDEIYNAPR